MAKLTLTDLTSGYALTSTVNANNALIEAEFDNCISRDGSSPNSMNAQLDMNSNRIVNLPLATNNSEPITLAQAASIQSFTGVVATSGSVGAVLWPQTSAESTAAVTPSDYSYEPGDVRRYGAVLDGVTDDYTAINNALTAYDTIYIPEGDAAIQTTITMAANKRIVGAGQRATSIKCAGSITTGIIVDDRCVIENLAVTGEGTGTTTNGIKTADTAARVRLSNINVTLCANGLNLTACWVYTIDQCFFESCTNGIYVNNEDNYDDPVNAINIIGGEIRANTYGIHFKGGAGGLFSVNCFNCFGATIEGNSSGGVWVDSNAAIQTISYYGTYFEANGPFCHRQDPSAGSIKFDGCLFFLDAGASDKGIDVTAGTTQVLTVQNCEFDRTTGSATEGIDLGASATINQVLLIGNVWDDAAIILTNDASAKITSIADERENTKLPDVRSLSGAAAGNSEVFMGKVTFGSADTTKAVSLGATEADANYFVDVYGFDWDHGAVWVTAQTTTGFTINVTTARGSGSQEVVWELKRR